MSTDGIAAMQATRDRNRAERSRRQVPPPRHKAKQQPAAETSSPEPLAPAPEASRPPAAGLEELSARTIHLDRSSDDWLEDIAIAGRRARPRVAISRSAVVRYALEQLRADTDAETIVAALAARGEHGGAATGRKRR
ncbi:hypothetical protein [Barrientosiimonas humi]|uniref:hypothetical protein n=1 Tax=Barrientosiimonas humi TaxID=999931 RepID=UPI00370D2EC7